MSSHGGLVDLQRVRASRGFPVMPVRSAVDAVHCKLRRYDRQEKPLIFAVSLLVEPLLNLFNANAMEIPQRSF